MFKKILRMMHLVTEREAVKVVMEAEVKAYRVGHLDGYMKALKDRYPAGKGI